MNKCGVYIHINPIKNEIFYVGIFKQSNRPYSKHARNKHWHNIVNKYGYDILILEENLTWEEAQKVEVFLIAKIGRTVTGEGTLVNKTLGGDGNTAPRTLESNLKRSQAQKGISKGPCSEQTKQKLSAIHKQRYALGLSKKHIIEYNENHKRGNHNNARKVDMFTKEGIYIKTFECRRDAKDFIKKGDLTPALKNWNATAGGYRWKYTRTDEI